VFKPWTAILIDASSFFCLDTKKRSKKKSRLSLLRSKN